MLNKGNKKTKEKKLKISHHFDLDRIEYIRNKKIKKRGCL